MNHLDYCEEPYDRMNARLLFLQRCGDFKIQPTHMWIGYFILKRIPKYGKNNLNRAEGLVLFLIRQFDYQRDLSDLANAKNNRVYRDIRGFVESNRWNFTTIEEPPSLTAQDTFILQHDHPWLTDEYFAKVNTLLEKLSEKGLQLNYQTLKAAACYVVSRATRDEYGTYLRQSELGRTFNIAEVSIRSATRKAEELLT